MANRCIFVTGSTGYIGRALIGALLARSHSVRALARKQNSHLAPRGATIVEGDALDAATFERQIGPADTLVHLVGTPHPNPAKAASFRDVDLRSVDAAVSAAQTAGIRHFIYLSVAQPAPVMRAYVKAREAGEAKIRASGIEATFLRAWYVLGPGHRWPYVLLPVYAAMEMFPATREFALRLGMVTLEQMVTALIAAVETGPNGVQVLDVPLIRKARLNSTGETIR